MCLIIAKERRHVISTDIPGAFMQSDIDELIHVKLEGEIADLLIRRDPHTRSTSQEKMVKPSSIQSYGRLSTAHCRQPPYFGRI